MGYMSVYETIRAINGEETPEIEAIPVLPVTKDNIAEFKEDATAILEKYGVIKKNLTSWAVQRTAQDKGMGEAEWKTIISSI